MIKFIKMSVDDFKSYLNNNIKEYAEEHVKAGNWSQSESIEKSTKELEKLLPHGVDTKNHYLFTILEESTNEKLGILWVKITKTELKQTAFIYDIRISSEFRGKSYGKQTLHAMEQWLSSLGIKSVSLHVFGHNIVARNLYTKYGFEVVDLIMSKKIDK